MVFPRHQSVINLALKFNHSLSQSYLPINISFNELSVNGAEIQYLSLIQMQIFKT